MSRVFAIHERELTLSSVERVRQAFWIWLSSGDQKGQQGGETRIVVDLGGVELMTTPGLGLLLEMRSVAREQGLELVLKNPSGMIRDVIGRTQLDRLLVVEG